MATGASQPDPVLDRLQAQLGWYDRAAGRSRLGFIACKTLSLGAAAAIPILSGFGDRLLGSIESAALVVGLLGAAIVLLEGFLRLLQLEQNWLNYRTTWQALDREQALYRAGAGPYDDAENPRSLLAERVEDLIMRENAGWAVLQEERRGRDKADRGGG